MVQHFSFKFYVNVVFRRAVEEVMVHIFAEHNKFVFLLVWVISKLKWKTMKSLDSHNSWSWFDKSFFCGIRKGMHQTNFAFKTVSFANKRKGVYLWVIFPRSRKANIFYRRLVWFLAPIQFIWDKKLLKDLQNRFS